ncbi:MAG: transporter, partial [Bacteroidota bacterium]
LLFVLSLQLGWGQSPWAQGAGKQYHQLAFNTVLPYSKLFGLESSLDLPRQVSDVTLQYYGELGIGNKLTLGLDVPFKFLKTGDMVDTTLAISFNEAGSLQTFGDIEVFAKYQLLSINGLAFGLLMNVGIPTSSFQAETELKSGFNAWKVRPGLSLGYANSQLYVYGFGSYAWYGEEVFNRIYLGAEIGLRLSEKLIIAAFLSSFQAIEEDGIGLDFNLTGLYINGQQYNTVTFKIINEFIPNKFGAFAAFGGGSGDLVASSPALTFGVFLR